MKIKTNNNEIEISEPAYKQIQFRNRLLGGALGFVFGISAAIFAPNLRQNYGSPENETNNSFVHVEENRYACKIADMPKFTALNIYSKDYPDSSACHLRALDYNKDGVFDALQRMHAIDSEIEKISNFDSVGTIYRRVNKLYQKKKSDDEFRQNYSEHKKYWENNFLVPFDTLVRSEYGGMYALTDISKNGVDYDIVQYIGSMPGSYSIDISSDYRDELEKIRGTILIPYGINVREVPRTELNTTIKNIIGK